MWTKVANEFLVGTSGNEWVVNETAGTRMVGSFDVLIRSDSSTNFFVGARFGDGSGNDATE